MKKIIVFTLVFVGLALLSSELWAQCPMCKMAAESNLKNGGSAGRGLNAGILYMLSLPYVLVGAIAFFWWRNRRNSEDKEVAVEN